jgi:uncharacterized protein YdaU (DUF1376 family)
MNYYSHHIGDYTTDTAHLSLLEDGAYRRLMDRYYTTEAPLPADEAALFRVVRARLPDEQEAVRIVLAEFFDLTDAGWTHKRCDAEIEAFKAKSGKAADAANKRWGKSGNAPAVPPEKPPAMPTQCQRNADAMPTNNQEPITNNQEPEGQEQSAQTTEQAEKPAKKPDATASRLPADWMPDEEAIAFCQTERPDLQPHEVADRFRDYWIAQPGVKGRKTDWPATWRNWVRNEKVAPASRAGPTAGPQQLSKAGQATARNIESWLEKKRLEQSNA